MTVSSKRNGRKIIYENDEWVFADSRDPVPQDPVWAKINNLENRIEALELQINTMNDHDSG